MSTQKKRIVIVMLECHVCVYVCVFVWPCLRQSVKEGVRDELTKKIVNRGKEVTLTYY